LGNFGEDHLCSRNKERSCMCQGTRGRLKGYW
jgi:hypothetical protein